ncbi:MAG TPA: acyl-CoA reductase, partial [Myxococcota bacterium]|nr:acyl-CoA reductase [Myxococcota bacterium]
MTPDDIADQLAALRDAGVRLKRRPYRELLEALGAVLEGWRNPDSAWRRELVEQLPAATGFTAPLVREGLQRALDGWTRDALRELALRELGSPEDLDAESSRSVDGWDVTAVWLAGSIPMPSLLALIAPLAVRSPVLAKAASRDPVTPDLVARSIEETDAELGRCIRIASFPAQRLDLTDALLQADCVCATGSDEAIAALRARAGPARHFVADGHRFSVAAVAPPDGAQLRVELAQRLAVDVALWDQLGCLSPIEVFAVDRDASFAIALGEALAGALAHAEKIWPRGSIDARAAH